MKIEEWNAITKDEETQVIAEEGDLCTVIDGVAFLVQRRNDFNNIVCIRIEENRNSILTTFCNFREWCKENELQFVRVEGISHTYKMLYLVARRCNCNVVYDMKESKEYNSHIYYIKVY